MLLLSLNSSASIGSASVDWPSDSTFQCWLSIPAYRRSRCHGICTASLQASDQRKKISAHIRKKDKASFRRIVMQMLINIIIIIIIINSLTARVVGAPHMILQLVFSIFPCSPLPSGTWRTPGLSIPSCCLPNSSSSALSSSPFHCALQDGFGQT